ncbi:MAG: hypothetical protein IT307_02835 [Chloroflexi bacterium]|nr:hypothetical protein [Chloroflexota bacterium]
MDDDTPEQPSEPEALRWPHRQVYFLTIDWLDEPHQPATTERLARAVAHALEHAHAAPHGSPPARFVVRVKAGDVASEVEGTIQPHHHHEPTTTTE